MKKINSIGYMILAAQDLEIETLTIKLLANKMKENIQFYKESKAIDILKLKGHYFE